MQLGSWLQGGGRSHLSSTDWLVLALLAGLIALGAMALGPVLDPIAAREAQVLGALERAETAAARAEAERGAPVDVAPVIHPAPSDLLHGNAPLMARLTAGLIGAGTASAFHPWLVALLAVLAVGAGWLAARILFDGSIRDDSDRKPSPRGKAASAGAPQDPGRKPSPRGKAALATLLFVCSPGFFVLAQGAISQALALIAVLVTVCVAWPVMREDYVPGRWRALAAAALATAAVLAGGALGLVLALPPILWLAAARWRLARRRYIRIRDAGFRVDRWQWVPGSTHRERSRESISPAEAMVWQIAGMLGAAAVVLVPVAVLAAQSVALAGGLAPALAGLGAALADPARIGALLPAHAWAGPEAALLALLPAIAALPLIVAAPRGAETSATPAAPPWGAALTLTIVWTAALLAAPSSLSIACMAGLGAMLLTAGRAAFRDSRPDGDQGPAAGTETAFAPQAAAALLFAGLALVVALTWPGGADHPVFLGILGLSCLAALALIAFRPRHSLASLLTALALLTATAGLGAAHFGAEAARAGARPMATALWPYRVLADPGDRPGLGAGLPLYVHPGFDAAMLGYGGAQARIVWSDGDLAAAPTDAYLILPADMAAAFPDRLFLAEVPGGRPRRAFHLLGGGTDRLLQERGLAPLVTCLKARRAGSAPPHCAAFWPAE